MAVDSAHHHVGQRGEADRRRADLRPDASIAAPVVEAGDSADAWLVQRGEQYGEIVRADHHIAVGQDQDVVAGWGHHRGDIAYLGVCSGYVRAGGERDIGLRMGLAQCADRGDCRIVRRIDAEDNLHRPGKFLDQKASEIVSKLRLCAMQRLEQGDRRLSLSARGGHSEKPPQSRQRDQLIGDPDHRQRGEAISDPVGQHHRPRPYTAFALGQKSLVGDPTYSDSTPNPVRVERSRDTARKVSRLRSTRTGLGDGGQELSSSGERACKKTLP